LAQKKTRWFRDEQSRDLNEDIALLNLILKHADLPSTIAPSLPILVNYYNPPKFGGIRGYLLETIQLHWSHD